MFISSHFVLIRLLTGRSAEALSTEKIHIFERLHSNCWLICDKWTYRKSLYDEKLEKIERKTKDLEFENTIKTMKTYENNKHPWRETELASQCL